MPGDWNPLRSAEQAYNRQKMLCKAAGLKSEADPQEEFRVDEQEKAIIHLHHHSPPGLINEVKENMRGPHSIEHSRKGYIESLGFHVIASIFGLSISKKDTSACLEEN